MGLPRYAALGHLCRHQVAKRGCLAMLWFEILWNLIFTIGLLEFLFRFRCCRVCRCCGSCCLGVDIWVRISSLNTCWQPRWELPGEMGSGTNAVSPRGGSAHCFLFLRRQGPRCRLVRLGLFEESCKGHAAEVHSGLLLPFPVWGEATRE